MVRGILLLDGGIFHLRRIVSWVEEIMQGKVDLDPEYQRGELLQLWVHRLGPRLCRRAVHALQTGTMGVYLWLLIHSTCLSIDAGHGHALRLEPISSTHLLVEATFLVTHNDESRSRC